MRARGFTMLELLLVILITGILAAVVAPVIREPVRAYFDTTARAALVDAAEAAMRRMARDVRRALPYSIRSSAAGDVVEFFYVRDVARYQIAGGNNSRLRFDQADASFNLVGRFNSVTAPYTLAGTERLVISNLANVAGYDAYSNDAVITPAAGTTITITDAGNEHNVAISPGFQFQSPSPSNRVFLVNGRIAYGCSGGGFFRLSGIAALAPQPDAAAVAGGDLMAAADVANCTFDYDPGNATRPELLILRLTLSRDGQTVTLLHQIHVQNAT